MRLTPPNIVSDEAGVCFNRVREGYCLCGEARAETSTPEGLSRFSHTYTTCGGRRTDVGWIILR